MVGTKPLMRALAVPISALVLMSAGLSGCGQSSASPTPVPTKPPARLTSIHVDGRAVATARKFLRAFRRGDRRTMIRMMSPRLLQRNRHEFVAQMLGIQNVPVGVSIARARSYRARWGGWTRVTAQLQFDHGMVMDQLGITRTRIGYRVDSIKYLQASG